MAALLITDANPISVGTSISLSPALKKDNVKSGSGAIDHVAFNCEDIEGMKNMFDSKSIEYTHRKVPGFPLEQLFVDDPDGVKVELNFPTKD